MAKKEIKLEEMVAAIDDMWQLLTDGQRELVAKNIEARRYKKHQVIYTEGEMPKHLLCLIEGKVKIYRDGVGGCGNSFVAP